MFLKKDKYPRTFNLLRDHGVLLHFLENSEIQQNKTDPIS